MGTPSDASAKEAAVSDGITKSEGKEPHPQAPQSSLEFSPQAPQSSLELSPNQLPDGRGEPASLGGPGAEVRTETEPLGGGCDDGAPQGRDAELTQNPKRKDSLPLDIEKGRLNLE